MTLRTIATAIGGLILWGVLFNGALTGFGYVWPDYGAATQAFLETMDFSPTTTAMMFLNLTVFAIAGLGTGWFVTAIGKSRTTALVVGLLVAAFGAYEHFFLTWTIMPAWYNIADPVVIFASVYIGTLLAGGRAAEGANLQGEAGA